MITYYSKVPEFTYNDFCFTDLWKEEESSPKDSEGRAIYIIDQSTGRRYLNLKEGDRATDACIVSSAYLVPCAVASGLSAVVRFARLASCYHLWPCRNKQIEIAYYKTKIQVLTTDKLDKKIVIDYKEPIAEQSTAEEEGEDIPLPLPSIAWPEHTKTVSVHAMKSTSSTNWRCKAILKDSVLMIATPFTCLAMNFFSLMTCAKPTNNHRKLYKTFERLQFEGYIVAERSLNKGTPSWRVVEPPQSMTMA